MPPLPNTRKHAQPPLAVQPDIEEREFHEARFAIEYLRTFNALDAAEAIGFSRKSGSARNFAKRALAKPHVRQLIRDGISDMSARVGVTDDRTIREMARIAFVNVFDLIKMDGENGAELDLSRINREIGAAIVGIDKTVTIRTERNTGAQIRTVTHKLKLADKRAALADLAKVLCLFQEDKNRTKELDTVAKLFDEMMAQGGSRVRPAQ